MKNLKTSLLSLLLAVMLVFGTIAPVLPAFADEQGGIILDEGVQLAPMPLLEQAVTPTPVTTPAAIMNVPLTVSEWQAEDFTYAPIELTDAWNNTQTRIAITGFSDSGKAKLAVSDTVVLSPVDTVGNVVTAIGKNAFYVDKKVTDPKAKIKTVIFPDTVKDIEDYAFFNNLIKELRLPKELERIGTMAFAMNPIELLECGNQLDTISTGAFAGNKLKQIRVPSSLRNLTGAAVMKGNSAAIIFERLENQLKEASAFKDVPEVLVLLNEAETLKNGIKDFSSGSLKGANDLSDRLKNAMPTYLKSIENPGDLYVPKGMALSDVLKQLPGSVNLVGINGTIKPCAITKWDVSGYSAVEGAYEAIGTVASSQVFLQPTPPIDLSVRAKVVVGDSIASISDFTFNGTVITGFSETGKEKFKQCKIVVLPAKNPENKDVTEIGDSAFIGKISTRQDAEFGINMISIPETVTTIGKEAFRYNALKYVKLPSGIKWIKDSAFNGNLIQTLKLPDSLTDLGPGAFTLNEISNIEFSKNLTVIPVAFGYNKLKTVTIPEGVKKIEDMAFSDNDLKEAILPNTLEYLSGFNNNEFASIIIPKSVKVIGKKAFARNRIKEVVIPGNVISVGESAFQNSWHDVYLEKATLEEGIQKLDKYAFSSNQLREVNLPASLKELDPSAFYKNLGYNETLVTHLFTPDLKNPKGLKNAKFHQVNPAKLTINYILNGKIEKTETIVTHPESKGYFTIGDTVSIKPSFKHTAYGLVDPNPVNITLNGKENTLTFQLQNKVVVDTPVIETVGRVPAVAVALGTSEEEVIKKLAKKSCIFDSNGKEYAVDLIWKLESYSGNKVGEYKAKATFSVPVGVSIVGGSLKPELETVIIVKQSPAVLKASNWVVDDFIIENKEIYGDPHIAVLGFSAKGEEKLKTNKALVIPKTNANGDLITAIYQESFEDKGLTSVVLPEGLPSLDIGSAAFQLNELTDVVIPDGVKEIRTYAFNKNNLRTVDIPKTVTKIGNKAFSDNKLVVVNFSLDIENVWLDRFSFNNNLLSEVTIIKDPGKIHHEAFKDNIGYDNNKNRVKVYTLNLNVDDQNHVFPYSHYHEMVMLKIENINDIPGMKDQVELILSNGDKVKVDEKKCKSQDFNKKRQEQLANKNKTPGTPGNHGNAGKPGKPGAPGSGNGNAQGNKPGAPNAPQVPGKPTAPNAKGAPMNQNAPNITKYKDMAKVQWAQEAVKDLTDKKIISGYKNDYRPNDKMKKAEFAAILVKAFELDEVKSDLDFKDVKKSDWYYDAISKLAALDMISGDGTGKFNPEDEITREQMIKMLMQLMNSKYPERLNTVEGVTGFKDQGKVSSWASEEMEQAMALNLISGFSDSTIKPQDETTRGQAAVVVYKALQLVE